MQECLQSSDTKSLRCRRFLPWRHFCAYYDQIKIFLFIDPIFDGNDQLAFHYIWCLKPFTFILLGRHYLDVNGHEVHTRNCTFILHNAKSNSYFWHSTDIFKRFYVSHNAYGKLRTLCYCFLSYIRYCCCCYFFSK